MDFYSAFYSELEHLQVNDRCVSHDFSTDTYGPVCSALSRRELSVAAARRYLDDLCASGWSMHIFLELPREADFS